MDHSVVVNIDIVWFFVTLYWLGDKYMFDANIK